jgi:hypothetical protein
MLDSGGQMTSLSLGTHRLHSFNILFIKVAVSNSSLGLSVIITMFDIAPAVWGRVQ